MKLVVRVQYIGERARLLLREDQAAEYTKGLIDDLEYFGFPMPHEQKPIEKSGFMLCVWHVDRDSDLHHIIQDGFMKAKAEAHLLLDRGIRYISLNEDGIMHTTSLANKPYKPKGYNKQVDYQSSSSPLKTTFGKAPKYPTVISQARKAVTPLSQRIAGPDYYGAGLSSHYEVGSRDVDMQHAGEHTPPASGSDASANVLDVTQQTLIQLSQSSAFQSLLHKSPSSPPPVKIEPASPANISSLLRQPASPPSQPGVANIQALLEKAGVKPSSAQAFLSAQSSLANSAAPGAGDNVSTAASANASLIAPASSAPTMLLGTQKPSSRGLSSASNLTGSVASLVTSRPASTTPVPTSRGSAAHAATRELWDVRRQITALQAQESSLESELRRAGQPVPPKEGASTSTSTSEHRVKALEDEIAALREELQREQQTRKVNEALLRAERARRTDLENMMKETTREFEQPFVVPALWDAFMKIGQMTGDALKDAHAPPSGSVAMEL